MPDRFASFLAASLGAVQRDAPASARAVAGALGAAVIQLVVDGERVIVRGGSELAIAGDLAREPDVEVATTARALLALLDGDDELIAAVIANRVRVRAAPGDAVRLFDAMRWFVEGCARTAAAQQLLHDYRCHAEPTSGRPT